MSKYSVSDDHWGEDDEPLPDDSPIKIDHMLTVNDGREEIDRYNGLKWRFIFDGGMITAVDKSHYCPGPGHTDPMGFREWDDVPPLVQRAVLNELNVDSADEVVDVEAMADAAEDQWP